MRDELFVYRTLYDSAGAGAEVVVAGAVAGAVAAGASAGVVADAELSSERN